MTKKPLISVLCSSFNHSEFVGYFMNSLINQTYKNWELIIIDDCSIDNNVEEIKIINDPRIKLFTMDVNSGSSIVTTKAFSLSKGEIIVDLASDDALIEDYFEIIVNIFNNNSNIGVIYSPLLIINEHNVKKEIRPLPQKNRIELLKDLFYVKNVLYSPGYATRREFYELLVPMNFSLIQHQDYQWHIKLLINTDCYLLPEPHVLYRIQDVNSTSLGTRNISANNRYNLEIDYLMNTFLTIKDTELVEKICNNPKYTNFDKDLIPFVFGMCALNSNDIYKRQWGYKTLLNFFENSNNFYLVNRIYGFTFKDMLSLSSTNFYTPIILEKRTFYQKTKSFIKKILIKLNLYK